MKTNKNIDRLFQEKLKDFEVSPPDNIWKGIERNLNTNKPTTAFPLWLRIGSAAAVLILLTIGGVNYFNSESSDINNNTIVNDSYNENTPKVNDDILKKDILNSTDSGNAVAETEGDSNINGTNSENENTPKTNKESIKRDILNSTKNGSVIAEAGNSDNTVIGYYKEGTPKINKESLKRDLLKSSENGSVIVNTENNENKNNVLTNKMVTDDKLQRTKQQNNSEQVQQQNSKNTIANIQSKKATNNLVDPNSKIAANNNSLKQDASSFRNNKDNLKNSSDTNVATIDKDFKSNSITDFSNESQPDKVVGNLDENLTNSNEKQSSDQADLNKINESKNTVVDTDIKELESLEDVLETIEEEEDNKKWSVASVFAPVAYNSFNEKGSPLDTQFENSPKQGSKTMSYGVKVAYKVNKKLSFQSGVSLVNVGYKVGNVFVNPNQRLQEKLVNVAYNDNFAAMSVSATNFSSSTVAQLENRTSIPTETKGVLNQEFGYIEVPLEVKYKINNSEKFGVNLVGGFSTLLLNKNEVSVETAEFSSNIGEANNLNKVNFSGNFGIDIDYKINKNLYLNIAPMLKIQTSTFSKNADNFKPYIIGVYSGLNYKF